ncbi:MAG: hypothetical protein AUK47_27285 [Deltaproteobacteria bacterium CG2_30_63_29]|nr:MAG: hypothetical protein AUK47_27285 [Deltaproteobacteria bacterium CG2_30_63_29]
MRVLLWYCDRFAWQPALKTLEEAREGTPGEHEKAVVAFVHVEPKDVERIGKVETRLLKQIKWLMRKWETPRVVLHSFTHLGEEKAPADVACALLERVGARLEGAGLEVLHTPWGHFVDLQLAAPGHPLARVFTEF